MKIKIQRAKKRDITKVSMLVSKTFAKFCSNEGTKEGVKEYINFHNPKMNLEVIKKNYFKSPIFFVATQGNKIIGMIRGNSSRIVNLFVEGKSHKKGIAKELVLRFEREAKKNNSKEIKIRASLYATPFYERVGYRKTTGIKNFLGIKVQPMAKKLK